MARKTANIRICDYCRKTQSDEGSPMIGGSVFTGWLEVHLVNGSTHLQALQMKRDFDFCSLSCMKDHFEI